MDTKRIVFVTGLSILAMIVVYAFAFVGSPADNRKLLEDNLRLNNLKNIDCYITAYYRHHNRVPAVLTEAEKFGRDLRDSSVYECGYCYLNKETKFADPVTNAEIKYTPELESYTICTEFNFSWDDMKKHKNTYNHDWAKGYTTGEYCFKRTVPKCKKKDR